jgi:16S rRNA (guanine966-N2)-methyltransferase
MTATRRPAGAAGATRISSGRNRVRIIAGEWRSRILRFPETAQLRPTPDRVRETLFNWLGQRLDGLDCLDLFAGSGALGFEALSRGARRVVMLERDRPTAALLRQNAQALGAAGAEIVEADTVAWLRGCREEFDVAFVDPPYASGLVPPVLAALPQRLRRGARVYVETADALPDSPAWRVLRQDRAGAVRYALLESATP